jgi:hypothetical protein
MSRFRCRLTISFCAIICWFIARRTIRKSACLRTGADRGRRRPFVRAAAAAAAFVSFARAVAAAAGVADEGEQLRELIQRDDSIAVGVQPLEDLLGLVWTERAV